MFSISGTPARGKSLRVEMSSLLVRVRKRRIVAPEECRVARGKLWRVFLKFATVKNRREVLTRLCHGVSTPGRDVQSRMISLDVVRATPVANRRGVKHVSISMNNVDAKRKKWTLIKKRMLRMHQRMALIHEVRRLPHILDWERMAHMLATEWAKMNTDVLVDMKEVSLDTALEFVNTLTDVNIRDLRELPKRGDGMEMPLFRDESEIMELFVNQRLRQYSLPNPESDDEGLWIERMELREMVQTTEFNPALMALPVAKLGCLATMTEIEKTLYVNNRCAYEIIDDIFGAVKYPFVPNTVADRTAEMIVRDDVFDSCDVFGTLDMNGIWEYRPIDPKRLVNDRLAEDMSYDIMMSIKMPLVKNDIDSRLLKEITSDDLCSVLFSGIDEKKMDNIRRFAFRDIGIYVNSRAVDEVLDSMYNTFELPIEANETAEDVVRSIEYERFDDVLIDLSNVDIRPIVEIGGKINVDGSIAYEMAMEIVGSELDNFPLCLNVVDMDTVTEIARFEDPSDVLDVLNYEHCECVDNFMPADVRRLTNDNVIDDIIGSLLENVPIPLGDNDVTEDDIDRIVTLDDWFGVDTLAALETDCLGLKFNDIQLYVNDGYTNAVIMKLTNAIDLPVVRNVFDDETFDEIVDDVVEDSLWNLVHLDLRSSKEYIPKDSSALALWQDVDAITDEMFDYIELPIGPNVIDMYTVDCILYEDYSDVVPGLGDIPVDPLCEFDPVHHKTDFRFPITADMFMYDLLDILPIESNECTNELAGEVQSCLGIPGLRDFEFDLNDTRPLAEYVAPIEVFEDISDVVNRLIEKILRRDVLPTMPLRFYHVIDDSVAYDIVSGFVSGCTSTISGNLSMDPFKAYQMNEIPSYITAEDVVEILLNDVWPCVPLMCNNRARGVF